MFNVEPGVTFFIVFIVIVWVLVLSRKHLFNNIFFLYHCLGYPLVHVMIKIPLSLTIHNEGVRYSLR